MIQGLNFCNEFRYAQIIIVVILVLFYTAIRSGFGDLFILYNTSSAFFYNIFCIRFEWWGADYLDYQSMMLAWFLCEINRLHYPDKIDFFCNNNGCSVYVDELFVKLSLFENLFVLLFSFQFYDTFYTFSRGFTRHSTNSIWSYFLLLNISLFNIKRLP